MTAILLVDEDPYVRSHWIQALRTVQPEWAVLGAATQQDALQLLQQPGFDAVAAHVGLPGTDGVLLEDIRDRHPGLLRIALCDATDPTTIGTAAGVAHRVIPRYCEPHRLVAAVAQGHALRARLEDDAVRRVVTGLDQLPSLPALYRELVEELRSPEASLHRAANIIAKDLGMTSKILQVANSAYFAASEPIATASRAVVRLGLETVSSLVLLLGVFTQFQGRRHAFFTLEALWRHGLATARTARTLAQEEDLAPADTEQVFTSGLLHDLGILVLATNLPDLYTKALALAGNEGLSEWEAERAVFGTTHAEVGAYLLGLWGVGAPVVDAVAFHHEPDRSARTQGFTPLVATHVADVLEYQAHAGRHDQVSSGLREDYLAQCGVRDRLPLWLARVRHDRR